MLDFVPNHTALDHPWVEEHPEYYVAGSEIDLAREPHNYTRVKGAQGGALLAHGRDPYFPGWPDTLQLDYANRALQDAMIGELARISTHCDGVRCDMAMLVLPDGLRAHVGSPRAAVLAASDRAGPRARSGVLLHGGGVLGPRVDAAQQGFDYAYDKRLYDRLRAGDARPVREHLCAGLDYQTRLARFLENHDEPRAAATFPPGVHEAAAVISFLAPGLRFFHQGQLEGRRKRISPHLVRAPQEAPDAGLQRFYGDLLGVLRRPACRDGEWRLLECVPAWDGNPTSECFVASAWQGPDGERLLVAVNYAGHQSQCYVRGGFSDLGARKLRLRDLMSAASYDREGDDLLARGLFLDLPAWGFHVFELTTP